MNKIFKAIESKNEGKNVMKEYPTMPHGWMAARGDVSCLISDLDIKLTDQLESEDGKKNFSDGYEVLSKFFKANL